MAGRPPEYTIDEAGLAAAEAGALEGLRVGQTLTVVMVAAVAEAATAGDEAAVAPQPATTSGSGGLFLMTEAGAKLCVAPTAAPGGARGARTAPGQAFMVKSIKRSPATGGLVQLQVRLCQAKAPQRPGASAGTGRAGSMQHGMEGVSSAPPQQHQQELVVADEFRLTRTQYESLAGSADLKAMLGDDRLQQLLLNIDGAINREQVLAMQLERPDFQAFVGKVLGCLEPASTAVPLAGPT